ncbi:MAG: hypothetical protein QHH07_04575 [Sedimentisphaerales bacterium]|nr:hypothetical protein [Sedimentisphaerales bacterium]
MSRSLEYYHKRVSAPYAFQVQIDADYVDADCFSRPNRPIIVHARTFLSQLVWHRPACGRLLKCFIDP